MNHHATIKPNFLIAGAPRAGTTSLYDWLRQHPQVFLPDHKEPGYFVDGAGIRQRDRYFSLFAPGVGRRAIGEASAAYLAAPEAPGRIVDELPGVKLIFILRDPARRAASLYAWMVMHGYEWLPTFEQALAAEESRFHDPDFRRDAPQYAWDYFYFHSGLYARPLAQYYRTFGRAAIHVIRFEDLVDQPRQTFVRVCEFLDIDPTCEVNLEARNASRLPCSIRWQHTLRRWRDTIGLRPRLLAQPTRAVVDHLMRWNLVIGDKPTASPVTIMELRRRYADDIRRVSKLIHQDLDSWLPREGTADRQRRAA